MWTSLEKISQQVSKYGTFWSQIYYILVFVFRLIVVVTIGSAVYGDEQSAFRCSANIEGCKNLCYNEFAKISHMRFWSFQLLAVIAPTVFFHVYATYVSGEIEKLKKTENHLRMIEEGETEKLRSSGDSVGDKEFRKLFRRKRSIGNIKVKKIYTGDKLVEIPTTNKVHLAYYLTNIVKMGMEGFFMYIGFTLFYIESPICSEGGSCGNRNPFVQFLWMEVNQAYHCTGEKNFNLKIYYSSHLHSNGYIPCFVSRPFEKTVLFRYMNILSIVCFLICAIDLVAMTTQEMKKKRRKSSPKSLYPSFGNLDLVCSTGPIVAESTSKYPSNLCVPIKISESGKHVRLIDESKISDSNSNKSYI